MTAAYNAMADRGASYGNRVNVIAVDYPARDISSLLGVFVGSNTYFDGIADGFVKTVKLLQQVQTLPECENIRVTLGGYSQGAMVMHRVIQAFDLDQLLRFHVRSALLVADGDRSGTDYGVTHYGSAGTSRVGIGQLLPALSKSNSARFDKDINIHSVCMINDSVCAPDWTVPPGCVGPCANILRSARFLAGSALHVFSYRIPGALKNAAGDLA